MMRTTNCCSTSTTMSVCRDLCTSSHTLTCRHHNRAFGDYDDDYDYDDYVCACADDCDDDVADCDCDHFSVYHSCVSQNIRELPANFRTHFARCRRALRKMYHCRSTTRLCARRRAVRAPLVRVPVDGFLRKRAQTCGACI